MRQETVRLFGGTRQAVFVSRPNRFLVRAWLGDEEVEAHCPNPGRLLELLAPGRPVLLEEAPACPPPGSGPRRRTRWRLAACLYRGKVIPLDCAQANRVAVELVLPRLFPAGEGAAGPPPAPSSAAGGGPAAPPAAEVRFGACRFDFAVREGGRTLPVEVKACTLVEEGTAMFPDAPTRRGLRHLQELARHGGMMLFVIFNPQARRFLPNLHTDPDFSQALLELRGRLRLAAVSVETGPDGLARLADPDVPVELERLRGDWRGSGSYLLLARLPGPAAIRPGALGPILLPPGYYVYVGSGMGGRLESRLARHLRRRKRVRWHIDHLLAALPAADRPQALAIRSPLRLECRLAREVSRIAAGWVPGFGSSDCGCPSHLFRFAAPPLGEPAFLEALLRFRHRFALGL